jgi:GNAT superfamily N-acetyltransferase
MADLAQLLRAVADGEPPATDAELIVLTPPDERSVGVLAFPGFTVVSADLAPESVHALVPAGDPAAPVNPMFLAVLEGRTGRRVDNLDIVLCARGTGRRFGLDLNELTAADPEANHPRVLRTLAHRSEVRAWTCPGGLLVLGRGVAGRWEVTVEVDRRLRGFGLGRGLLTAALGFVPHDDLVWAQVAPGNAPSVRAALGAGYRPVGSEVLLFPPAELSGSNGSDGSNGSVGGTANGHRFDWFAEEAPAVDEAGDRADFAE